MLKFVIFIAIFLSVFITVNLYLYIRSCQALSLGLTGKVILGITIGFLAISYLLGNLLQKYLPFPITSFLQAVGSTWLMILLYGLLATVLVDILRLIDHFFHIFPNFIHLNYEKVKTITFFSIIGIIGVLFTIGYFRFSNPVISQLKLDLSTKNNTTKNINILVVSDLHLGYTIRNNRLEKFINQINSQNPDVVLMVGDIMDNNPTPVILQQMDEKLKQIKAPMGVYACTGNHEYIGDAETSCTYLQQAGITMLRDTSILIDNKLYIIGREDLSSNKSKPLADITSNLNPLIPKIVLDHQPSRLAESIQNQINLHLSGHTHRGQVFPINLITRRIYEVDYGYKQKDSTHVYVTSGLGIWGALIRIGSVSEIVQIDLTI